MIEIVKGSVDQTLYFKLVDDTTGSAKSGLVVSAIDATYVRYRRVSVKGDVSAVAASADSAHVDNQGFEVDATNAPGLYRIDFVDAAFANSSDVPQVICVINHVSCDPAMQAVDLVTKRSGELGIDIITSSVIAANAITAAKFAANAITATVIASDAIDASAIAAGTITAAKFASDAITASVIAASAITEAKFATGAITSGVIASDAIDASAIAAGAITAAKFAAGAIDAAAIAADAIDASAIAAGAITAAKFASDAITATVVADGAIDAATFAANAINASAVAADAVAEIWTTGLTEAYAADGVAFTGAQALFMIWAFLAEKAVTTTTLTANQLDGATPAMTFSLDSATAPTTITRAS